MSADTRPVIIIGTGLAGYALAREIRKLDGSVPLIMLTEDDGASYSKPMLSNALCKQKTPDSLIQSSAADMSSQYQLDVRTYTKVIGVSPDLHQITLASGEQLEYRQLVLATGARPRQLAIDDKQNVCAVNSLEHYRAFYQQVETAEHVTIIGSGLIGCEFANDLLNVGKKVSLVSSTALPLANLLPTAMSEQLLNCLSQLGLISHLNSNVVSITRDSKLGVLQVTTDQQVFETDLVMSAIGLDVDLSLAQQAGLAVSDAIKTNASLQTSSPDIFALGDCAEVSGLNLKYVMPIMQAARSLAATLAGSNTSTVTYPAMPVVIKTPAYPMVISPAINTDPANLRQTIETSSSGFGIKALYHDHNDKLQGFAISGDYVSERQALVKQLPPWL